MNEPNSPHYMPPEVLPNSTMAIISLVAGIASWIILPFIAAVVAVITGHMAKNEIKRSNGMLAGNGLATAGLVLGYIQLGLGLCVCLAVAVSLALGITVPFISNTIH